MGGWVFADGVVNLTVTELRLNRLLSASHSNPHDPGRSLVVQLWRLAWAWGARQDLVSSCWNLSACCHLRRSILLQKKQLVFLESAVCGRLGTMVVGRARTRAPETCSGMQLLISSCPSTAAAMSCSHHGTGRGERGRSR